MPEMDKPGAAEPKGIASYNRRQTGTKTRGEEESGGRDCRLWRKESKINVASNQVPRR